MYGMCLMAWVIAAAHQLKVNFQDAVGRQSTTSVWVDPAATSPLSAGPASIVTGLAGISDAVINRAELLMYATDDAPAAAEADPYDRPTDKLQLKLIGDDGVPAVITLPSVKEAYYQADKETPLTSAGPAKTLMDLIEATCVTADGSSFAGITSARRMIPRGLKSWNRK